MATANQIRINTGIDTSAISKGIAKLRQELDDLNKETSKSAQKAKELEGLEKRINLLKNKLDMGYGTEDDADDYRILVSEAEKLRNMISELANEEQKKKLALEGQIATLEQQREILQAIQAERRSDELNGKSRTSEQLKANINLLKTQLTNAIAINGEESEIVKQLQEELNLQEQLLSKTEERKNAVNEAKEAEKDNNNHTKEQKDGIGKIVGLAKTLTLSLIGARTVYAGIRKIITSATSDSEQLNNTINAFWASLGTMAQPVIQAVINGLAQVMSYIISIFSYLTGINILAKANAKLAKKSGSSSKKNAKNGNNLASFDTSEVLKRDSEDDNAIGGGGVTDNLLKQIELSEKLKAIFDKIKNITKEWWNNLDFQPLITAFDRLKSSVMPIIEDIGNILLWLYQNILLPFLGWLIEKIIPDIMNILAPALDIIHNIIVMLAPILADLWNNVLQPLFSWLGGLVDEVLVAIGNMLTKISKDMLDTNTVIGRVFEGVKGILSGIVEFITGVFTGDWEMAWNGVKNVFGNIWNLILDIVEGAVNGVISAINACIDAISDFLSGIQIPNWSIFGELAGMNAGTWFGSHKISYTMDLSPFRYVPALANGAVLPPNQPFMAMLGDQRNGMNLEAPEDLIRQIVREESGSQEVNIIADGSLSQFIKMIRFELQKEDKRVGTNLVMGG